MIRAFSVRHKTKSLLFLGDMKVYDKKDEMLFFYMGSETTMSFKSLCRNKNSSSKGGFESEDTFSYLIFNTTISQILSDTNPVVETVL